MTYSKDYNKEKYAEIESYLGQLETLDKEKVLSIATDSPEKAEHLRWLFYDYFHLTGAKATYILKVFNSLLLVGKVKPTMSNLTTKTEGRSIPQILHSIIGTLIASPNPRDALAQLVMNEDNSFTALSIILAEYGRVMGE